jgi:dTDP-glucose pyrophosphorylase
MWFFGRSVWSCLAVADETAWEGIVQQGAARVTAMSTDIRATLMDVMRVIERAGLGVALIVDERGRLLDTVTDGDVRRGFLNGLNSATKVAELINAKRASGAVGPITAPDGTDGKMLLELMRRHRIRQLPIVDRLGAVVDVVPIEDLFPANVLPVQAVVMAGGEGKRLRPLTNDLPKPMLRVGDRPIMERLVEQLRTAGIRRLSITTHYKPEAITAHFGDGTFFGVDISYVNEREPLGTAGSLGLLNPGSEPILVLNGDIIANVDFRAMLTFHQTHAAAMTIGTCVTEVEIPFGVVKAKGAVIKTFTEKPTITVQANAGVYLLEPRVLELLRDDVRCDMPELIGRLIAAGEPVAAYELTGPWLDVGRPSDYERAGIDYGQSGSPVTQTE